MGMDSGMGLKNPLYWLCFNSAVGKHASEAKHTLRIAVSLTEIFPKKDEHIRKEFQSVLSIIFNAIIIFH